MIYGELGRYPLYINASLRCIKYWLRLLKMDRARLPKQAYLMMLEQDKNGKRNWASAIRELLSKLALETAWNNQEVQEYSPFLRECKTKMYNLFLQGWKIDIRASERYSLYRECTPFFGQISYIDNIAIYCFRVALTQLRTGVLPLNSNMNRYGENPTRSYCPICKNVVEDEKHFMFDCPAYDELRNRFLFNMSVQNLPELLCIEFNAWSLNVAKFTFHSMKKRSQLIDRAEVELVDT